MGDSSNPKLPVVTVTPAHHRVVCEHSTCRRLRSRQVAEYGRNAGHTARLPKLAAPLKYELKRGALPRLDVSTDGTGSAHVPFAAARYPSMPTGVCCSRRGRHLLALSWWRPRGGDGRLQRHVPRDPGVALMRWVQPPPWLRRTALPPPWHRPGVPWPPRRPRQAATLGWRVTWQRCPSGSLLKVFVSSRGTPPR